MRLHLSRIKVPRFLGGVADTYYTIREYRYYLQSEIEKCRELEATMRNRLIDERPSDALIVGQIAKVKVTPKVSVKITSWEALHEYVRRYDAWDVMSRSVNEDAIRKLWAEGKEVPGTEPGSYHDVSAVKL